jgi:hypothetical protein
VTSFFQLIFYPIVFLMFSRSFSFMSISLNVCASKQSLNPLVIVGSQLIPLFFPPRLLYSSYRTQRHVRLIIMQSIIMFTSSVRVTGSCFFVNNRFHLISSFCRIKLSNNHHYI